MNWSSRKGEKPWLWKGLVLSDSKPSKYNIVCNDPKAQCDLNKSNKRKRKCGEEELQDQQKKPMITIHEDFHPHSSDDEDDEDEDVPCKFRLS